MEMETTQDSWTFQHPYTYTGFPVSSPPVSPASTAGTSSTFSEYNGFSPFSYPPALPPLSVSVSEEMRIRYPFPMTPPEIRSPPQTPFCSPRHSIAETTSRPPVTERQHITSGRRRAQNRAAQRAFRERKEKHARDLEARLAEMTDKYKSLEASHSELASAHDKLRRTLELLTSSSGDDGGGLGGGGGGGSSGSETLRRLLVLLHGDVGPAEWEKDGEKGGDGAKGVKIEGSAL